MWISQLTIKTSPPVCNTCKAFGYHCLRAQYYFKWVPKTPLAPSKAPLPISDPGSASPIVAVSDPGSSDSQATVSKKSASKPSEAHGSTADPPNPSTSNINSFSILSSVPVADSPFPRPGLQHPRFKLVDEKAHKDLHGTFYAAAVNPLAGTTNKGKKARLPPLAPDLAPASSQGSKSPLLPSDYVFYCLLQHQGA